MTLTRTRACARSAETWTPVTVTNPTRGSRTLPVRKAATVWRMASATRAGRGLRRCFMSEETGRRVHDAGPVGGLHQAGGLLQHPLGLPPVVRHHAHREHGALPPVVVGELGSRGVEALNADAALEALANLAHVVLEALERPDRPFVHLDAVADHPHPRRSGDHPRPDKTAGDGADLGDLERLPHLRLAQHHLFLLRGEQALHRPAHRFHRLVVDAVGADLDLLALRGS